MSGVPSIERSSNPNLPWGPLYTFWFQSPELTEAYYTRMVPYWFFGRNPGLDCMCKERFVPLLAEFDRGALTDWQKTAKGTLSLIILLDQIPRNAFRGTRKAYRYDEAALALTKNVLGTEKETSLNPIERIFLYMPLEHSENLEDQELSVEKFLELAALVTNNYTRLGLQKAKDHREVIKQFGRFPHRNAILDRASTPLEKEYLAGFTDEF